MLYSEKAHLPIDCYGKCAENHLCFHAYFKHDTCFYHGENYLIGESESCVDSAKYSVNHRGDSARHAFGCVNIESNFI